MNGEIASYDLKKPMRWPDFKSMPEHIQKEYIESLVNKFSVGPTALAEMFGVGGNTVSGYVKGKLGVTLPNYSSSAQRQRFIEKFCKASPPKLPAGNAGDETAAPVDVDVQPHREQASSGTVPLNQGMMLTKTTLSFSGAFNASLIADKLAALFQEGIHARVNIDIEISE